MGNASNKGNPRGKETVGPISEDKILAAIRQSGYPFEIELLTKLEGAGLQTVNGIRMPVMEGETRPMRGDGEEPVSAVTREIDTIATVEALYALPGGEGKSVSARMLALIEAKSLPSTSAFVGFPYKQPSMHDLRNARSRYAGAPSLGAIPFYVEGIALAGPLREALDPLNEAACCIQWALVERNKEGDYRADHPAKWVSAIWNLVRAIHYDARSKSEFFLSFSANGTAVVDLHAPCLFIKTPNLFLYDAATESLAPTNHLLLSLHIEVPGGLPEERLVNVFSDGAIYDFVERCNRVRGKLQRAIESHAEALIGVAAQQRDRFQRDRLRAAAEEARKEFAKLSDD